MDPAKFEVCSFTRSWGNREKHVMGENGAWVYRGTAQIFWVPLLSQERVKLRTSNFVHTFLVSIQSPVTVSCCCFQAAPSSWSTAESADHTEHISSVPMHTKMLSESHPHKKHNKKAKTWASHEYKVSAYQWCQYRTRLTYRYLSATSLQLCVYIWNLISETITNR